MNYDIFAKQISPLHGPVIVESTILAIPNISKAFALGYKKTATPVTLTWSIDNRSETALAAWGFTDALPAGLVVAPTPNATSDCFGTFAGAAAGSTSVSYSATSLPIDLPMCSISIDVQSSTAGTYVNSASNVTVT